MALYKYRMNQENWEYFKEVDFFFETFYHYIKEVDHFIHAEINSAKEKFFQFKQDVADNPSWEQELEFFYFDVESKEGLADIFYDSMIFTLYSFLEKKMLLLCKHIEKSSEIKLTQFAKDKGVVKYRKYLVAAINLDFSQIEVEWQKVMYFNAIRNTITHSEEKRTVNKENQALIRYLSGINGVELIDIGDQYIFHFRNSSGIYELAGFVKTIINYLFIERIEVTH